jgi:hypothetical protein
MITIPKVKRYYISGQLHTNAQSTPPQLCLLLVLISKYMSWSNRPTYMPFDIKKVPATKTVVSHWFQTQRLKWCKVSFVDFFCRIPLSNLCALNHILTLFFYQKEELAPPFKIWELELFPLKSSWNSKRKLCISNSACDIFISDTSSVLC